MVFQVECPTCLGTGVYLHHLLIRQTCPACQGTGIVEAGARAASTFQPGPATPSAELLARSRTPGRRVIMALLRGRSVSWSGMNWTARLLHRDDAALPGKPLGRSFEASPTDTAEWEARQIEKFSRWEERQKPDAQP